MKALTVLQVQLWPEVSAVQPSVSTTEAGVSVKVLSVELSDLFHCLTHSISRLGGTARDTEDCQQVTETAALLLRGWEWEAVPSVLLPGQRPHLPRHRDQGQLRQSQGPADCQGEQEIARWVQTLHTNDGRFIDKWDTKVLWRDLSGVVLHFCRKIFPNLP